MTELPTPSRTIDRLSSGPATVALWLIVALLAAHAGLALLAPPGGAALAQTSPAGAARADNSGVFLVPGQIEKDLWGAYLVDTRSGTIVLYQYNPRPGKLKLVAARTFLYDRYLTDYNTLPPTAEIRDAINNVKGLPADAPEDSVEQPKPLPKSP